MKKDDIIALLAVGIGPPILLLIGMSMPDSGFAYFLSGASLVFCLPFIGLFSGVSIVHNYMIVRFLSIPPFLWSFLVFGWLIDGAKGYPPKTIGYITIAAAISATFFMFLLQIKDSNS